MGVAAALHLLIQALNPPALLPCWPAGTPSPPPPLPPPHPPTHPPIHHTHTHHHHPTNLVHLRRFPVAQAPQQVRALVSTHRHHAGIVSINRGERGGGSRSATRGVRCSAARHPALRVTLIIVHRACSNAQGPHRLSGCPCCPGVLFPPPPLTHPLTLRSGGQRRLGCPWCAGRGRRGPSLPRTQ